MFHPNGTVAYVKIIIPNFCSEPKNAEKGIVVIDHKGYRDGDRMASLSEIVPGENHNVLLTTEYLLSLPRVLVVCDGVAPTGFSRVAQSILSRLHTRYEFHHLARIYRGDPHEYVWKVYAAGSAGDRLGVGRLDELIQFVDPNIVFTVADLWDQREYLRALSKHASRVKIVTYSPVESEPVSREWLDTTRIVTRFVVYTEVARQAVIKAFGDGETPPISVIPHGVDTDTFKGLPGGKVAAKRQLNLFKPEDVDGSFLVLNANRNQRRKRIDLTVRAFAAFARGKAPNVKLYLHMGHTDAGWNIFDLCRKHGVDDRLVTTHCERNLPSVSEDVLNLIYNASDVGINTSSCEGWGLSNLEHAATRSAQMMTRMPTLEEIWGEAAVYSSVACSIDHEGSLYTGRLANVESTARELERIYTDHEYRSRVTEECYRVALREDYQWNSIAQRWDQLFQDVLDTYLQ